MIEMKIRQIRRSKGLTVRELAEMSDTSKSQIDRIENGQQIPTIETLCRIAAALEVPVDATFTYKQNPPP